MTAYIETEDGKIQACWAQRIGEVHDQYLRNTQYGENKRDATMTLMALNSLLCYAKELIERSAFILLDDVMIDRSEISFFCDETKQPTQKMIFDCMRNAMCHPLGNINTNDSSRRYSATGFTSFNEEVGNQSNIKGFVFTHSPSVDNSGRPIRNMLRKSKNQFDLGDRLTLDDGFFCLDSTKLSRGPMLELKITISRLSEIVSYLSKALSPVNQQH